MKKFKPESIEKRVNNAKSNAHKQELAKQELINEIKEESKQMLLPNLKEKMQETTDLILKLLKEKDLNNIQIMSMIAKGSTLDSVLGGKVSYTPQELRIGFDLYLEMINKINEIKPFPPTVESFTAFMGISRSTYNDWQADYERKDVMDYIHSYILGVLATSSLTGEVKEISSIYLQKCLGRVEQTQPIVVEHKKITDINEIQEKLKSLRQNNVIEATYNERDMEKS
jgi:hypothetical protein